MQIVPVLAAVVEVTDGGKNVKIDPMMPMLISSLYLFIIFAAFAMILLYFSHKKKLQHQQIMAAMEKGLPVADLIEKPRTKELSWVKSLSAGIGLLFIGLFLAGMWWWSQESYGFTPLSQNVLIIAAVIVGFGIILFFRGIFQRIHEKPQYSAQVNGIFSLSLGIGMLFVGTTLAAVWWWTQGATGQNSMPQSILIIAICIAGFGLLFLIRGIMQKKYEKQQKKEKPVPAQ